MFDEAALNPAAALTLVALNSVGTSVAAQPMTAAGLPIASAAPILQQHPQQQRHLHHQHQGQQQQHGQQQQQPPHLAQFLSGKDTSWLQLEVCREFQRNQCTRSEQDCKYAHPPPHVDIQNGRVIACFDSMKAKCNRVNPKCKYLHPPQHLKDQLLATGKQNLVMKNLLSQQLSQQQQSAAPMQALSFMQHPGAPLLQSAATLPIPYFIPAGIFPGPAGLLPQADPFAALQNTHFQLLADQQHQQQQQQSFLLAHNPHLQATNGTNSTAASYLTGATTIPNSGQPIKRAKCENGGGNNGSNGAISNGNGATATTTTANGGNMHQQQNGGGTGLIGMPPSSGTTPAGMSMSAAAAAAAAAGIPLYAANPYLLPTAAAAQFLPAVSFAGQLPPRF